MSLAYQHDTELHQDTQHRQDGQTIARVSWQARFVSDPYLLWLARRTHLCVESFDELCDGSSLSELSSDPESEEDSIAAAQTEAKVRHPVPLDFDAKLICIDKQPLTDIMKDHRREISFKGSYKRLDIMCTCVVPSINNSYFDDMNWYEWEMSDNLLPCRSMATYINYFRSKRNAALNDIIGDTSDQSVWFFIKPYYEKGTLANYSLSKQCQGK